MRGKQDAIEDGMTFSPARGPPAGASQAGRGSFRLTSANRLAHPAQNILEFSNRIERICAGHGGAGLAVRIASTRGSVCDSHTNASAYCVERQHLGSRMNIRRRTASAWTRRGWVSLALFACIALPGCARTVSSSELTGFGTAAATLSRQTDANFAEANRIARSAAVDRFVRAGTVGLTEAPFAPAVPVEVTDQWRSAFSNLERYGLLLGTLTDPAQGKQTTAAFKNLGAELRNGVASANISPGVAAGFSALAGALVDMEAQQRAQEILRRTDPEVRSLLTAMADAVGASDSEGLRGTVASAWTASGGRLQRNYALAVEAKRDEDSRRAIVTDYLTLLDRRQAQLASLASMKSSLLALADAHSAAAAGSKRPIGELLGIIEDRLDEIVSLSRDIEKDSAK